MAAVKEFTLPDLGEGLTEAEIVRWLVEVGDVVAVDQPVVEVETAKAVVEVPCPYGGVVTARFGAEGDTLEVGRPLVTVAVGSSSGTAPGAQGDAGGGSGGGREADDEGSGNVLVGYGTGAAVARRRTRVRAVNAAAGHQGADGRPVGRPDSTPVAAREGAAAAAGAGAVDGGPVAVISPLVRRIAREHGLDLRALAGTGPEGLILRADVERAVAGGAAAAATGQAAPALVNGTAAKVAHAAPAPAVDGAYACRCAVYAARSPRS